MIGPTVYPSRVYKYVTRDRIDVLQNLTIRFTQPSALNDPFELKPIFSQMMSDERLKKELDPSFGEFKAILSSAFTQKYYEQSIEFRQEILLEQFVALFHEAIDIYPQILQGTITELMPTFKILDKSAVSIVKERLTDALSQLGILSLSSSGTNSSLWAHYADDSKGLAFEFDASHTFFHKGQTSSHPMLKFPNNDMLQLRAVHYYDHDPLSRSFYDIDGMQVLYTKQESWSHQAEWRVVAPLEQAKTKLTVNEEDIYLFEIPASALTRVIVGEKASSELVAKIMGIIDSRRELFHIEIAQIRVNLASQRLDAVPINGNVRGNRRPSI